MTRYKKEYLYKCTWFFKHLLQNRSSIVLLLFIRELIKIMTIVERSKHIFIDQDILWQL